MGELKRGKEKISAAWIKNIREQLQKDKDTIKSEKKVGRNIFDQLQKEKTQFERIKLGFLLKKKRFE